MSALGEAFQELLALLDLVEARHVICGSLASGTYGFPRQTNDVDIVADFRGVDLEVFCERLGKNFCIDPDEVQAAVAAGRSFNAIHIKGVFKFDLFPAGDVGLSQFNVVVLAGVAAGDVRVTMTVDGVAVSQELWPAVQ